MVTNLFAAIDDDQDCMFLAMYKETEISKKKEQFGMSIKKIKFKTFFNKRERERDLRLSEQCWQRRRWRTIFREGERNSSVEEEKK